MGKSLDILNIFVGQPYTIWGVFIEALRWGFFGTKIVDGS